MLVLCQTCADFALKVEEQSDLMFPQPNVPSALCSLSFTLLTGDVGA